MAKNYQVAAIPVRRSRTGAVEVMLVTSRETKRWVVPKGWPWRKTPDCEAAAGEAWEEAGIKGKTGRKALGSFRYAKLRKGKATRLKVRAYLMEVREQARKWPEVGQRRRRWFKARRAADLVSEPELKLILLQIATGYKRKARK